MQRRLRAGKNRFKLHTPRCRDADGFSLAPTLPRLPSCFQPKHSTGRETRSPWIVAIKQSLKTSQKGDRKFRLVAHPPTTSPVANKPGMGIPVLAETTPAEEGSTARPPNVNVIPPDTATAMNGGFWMVNAQFDLGRAREDRIDWVESPSLTAGSHVESGCSTW